jgi:hypothetical protein
VVWALWLAVEHGVPLDRETCRILGQVRESFGVLLVLLASRRRLLASQPSRTEWRAAMSTAELSGPRWLLSYEARHQRWMQSTGGGDHRSSDPFFSQLAAAGVSFMDLNARTRPTFRVRARPGGGGGAGGAAPESDGGGGGGYGE